MTWPGFVLLENPDLNTTNWVQVSYASGSGGDKPDHGGKTGCCADAYREAVLPVEEAVTP